jgi:hypothetical protein
MENSVAITSAATCEAGPKTGSISFAIAGSAR